MEQLDALNDLKDIHLDAAEEVAQLITSGSLDSLDSLALCKAASKFFIQLDFASCARIYRRFFGKFKDDPHFLYSFGYFACETGFLAVAEQLLKRSVELSPETDFRKYLILADMYKAYEPLASLQLYEKGINLALKEGEQLGQELSTAAADNEQGRKIQNKLQHANRTVSQAFCAVAELLMNSPDFPKNQAKISEMIARGEQADPSYLEPLYQRCFLHFNLEDESSCREEIAKFVAGIRQVEEANDEDLLDYPAEMLVAVVRMMIEGAIWEDGAYLAEIATQNDRKNYEAVYMLAFCALNADDLETCRESLEKLQEFDLSADAELAEAFEELKQEFRLKGQPQPGEGAGDMELEADGDDWEEEEADGR